MSIPRPQSAMAGSHGLDAEPPCADPGSRSRRRRRDRGLQPAGHNGWRHQCERLPGVHALRCVDPLRAPGLPPCRRAQPELRVAIAAAGRKLVLRGRWRARFRRSLPHVLRAQGPGQDRRRVSLRVADAPSTQAWPTCGTSSTSTAAQSFSRRPRLTVYRRETLRLRRVPQSRHAAARGRYSNWTSAHATLVDLLGNWRKPDGSFRRAELLVGWDNVPMHRWAQAQTFRSLSSPLASVTLLRASRTMARASGLGGGRRACRRHNGRWRASEGSRHVRHLRPIPLRRAPTGRSGHGQGDGAFHRAHRGPDDEGYYFNGPIGLGFGRPSIIDLAGGHQPMADAEDRLGRLQRRNLQLHRAAPRLESLGHVLRHNRIPRSSSTATSNGEPRSSIGSTACLASRSGTNAASVWSSPATRPGSSSSTIASTTVR